MKNNPISSERIRIKVYGMIVKCNLIITGIRMRNGNNIYVVLYNKK